MNATEVDKAFEKIAEAPAKALDKTVDLSREMSQSLRKVKAVGAAATYWNILGPGLTTGAADDDPSGIATYSQQGAQAGLQLLWLAAFTFPLMAIVQEMCARIGIVTDRGLAANIRRHYPKWALYSVSFLLLGANALNLGADIGAMAKATQLLLPYLNFEFLVVAFTVLIAGFQIYSSYRVYAKYLKYMAFILFAYVLSTLSIPEINWHEVWLHAVLPSLSFSKGQIFLITGILGTTISPYLFFWQTSQEVEDRMERRKGSIEPINEWETEHTAHEEIRKMRVDVWSGMFISNLVMFFIIIATASTLFTHGITNIRTAADAAEALRPLAGQYAYLLFAVGIIGAGMLAVPILAGSASYALSETFGWKTSLDLKLKDAYAFYGVIIISMLIGLSINFIGLDPIKVLLYSAVINGLIAPIILFIIVQLSSSSKIMGKYKNGFLTTTLGWITVLIMSMTAIATISFWIWG